MKAAGGTAGARNGPRKRSADAKLRNGQMAGGAAIHAEQLRRLSEFRFRLREFLHLSQEAAESAGLSAQQHQLLMTICGMPRELAPTIANVASRMFLKHNSTVELVDRSIDQGLLRRVHDAVDQRRIFLRLTAHGEQLLRSLASYHIHELERLGPELTRALRQVLGSRRSGVGGPAKAAEAHGRDGEAE